MSMLFQQFLNQFLKKFQEFDKGVAIFMLILNDTIKIGIERLLSVLGFRKNYKEVFEIKGYNFYYCNKIKCPICTQLEGQAFTEEKKNLIKENMCSNCPYSEQKHTIYYNEKNNYKVKEQILSKTRLLQFLLYHATSDSNGLVKAISFDEISKKLNISLRSVKDNNKFFIDTGLICSTRLNTDQISLFIIGYKNYFKSKEDYGRGYLEISSEILKELFVEKNINVIRLTLRELLKHNKLSADDEIVEFTYTYKEIKRFLPSYINCPKKIIDLIKNGTTNIFNTKFNKDGISLKIKENYDSKVMRETNDKKYKVKIAEHIFKQGRNLGRTILGETLDLFEITDIEIYMKDFVQMSHQYSLELVLYGIDYLITLILKYNFIGNYGGTVRNKIVEYIYGKTELII